MVKLGILVVNIALIVAIAWYGLNLYNKLHFQPAPETVGAAAPPSVPPKAGLKDQVEESRKKLGEVEKQLAELKQRQATQVKQPASPKEDLSKKITELQSSWNSFKSTQELKADQYQCKTDPLVLARLSKIEKWQKDQDDATKKQNVELDKLLKQMEEQNKVRRDAEESNAVDNAAAKSTPPPVKKEAPSSVPPPEKPNSLDREANTEPEKPEAVDWIYDIRSARTKALDKKRPILLAFNQSTDLCPKCYSVRENCYKNARCFGEISRNFVPYWPPTGWSSMTAEYKVTGFPTVVVDYGNNRIRSFAPSADPQRFLAQLKEYE